MKIGTVVENMLKFKPDDRWSCADVRQYLERTMFRVVEPDFN